MTEEREKELVAVYTSMILACTRMFAYPSTRIESSLRKLIRTVAAEAREEEWEKGIDEMRDALLEEWKDNEIRCGIIILHAEELKEKV